MFSNIACTLLLLLIVVTVDIVVDVVVVDFVVVIVVGVVDPRNLPLKLSQPQLQHNTTTTQPQHCSCVGPENDCTNPTPPIDRNSTAAFRRRVSILRSVAEC